MWNARRNKWGPKPLCHNPSTLAVRSYGALLHSRVTKDKNNILHIALPRKEITRILNGFTMKNIYSLCQLKIYTAGTSLVVKNPIECLYFGVAGFRHPHRRPGSRFQLSTSNQPSSGCCSNFASEPMDGRPLCFSSLCNFAF